VNALAPRAGIRICFNKRPFYDVGVKILDKIRKAGRTKGYRTRILDLVTEFLLEASVLTGVLGILDYAITARQTPTLTVIALSLGFAGIFFVLACILQALKDWRAGFGSGEE
jgi:hypothetical protein